MNKRDKADWEFWKRVAKIFGARLYGWGYQDEASFLDSRDRMFDVYGKSGVKLIEQEDEIDRLKALARHVINKAADKAAAPIEEWAEDRLREVENPNV